MLSGKAVRGGENWVAAEGYCFDGSDMNFMKLPVTVKKSVTLTCWKASAYLAVKYVNLIRPFTSLNSARFDLVQHHMRFAPLPETWNAASSVHTGSCRRRRVEASPPRGLSLGSCRISLTLFPHLFTRLTSSCFKIKPRDLIIPSPNPPFLPSLLFTRIKAAAKQKYFVTPIQFVHLAHSFVRSFTHSFSFISNYPVIYTS